MEENQGPAVGTRRVRPPIVLGSMLGIVLLYRAFGLPSPLGKTARAIGVPLMVGGLALAGSAFRAQMKAGTAVDPDQPTTVLVESGPYRFTRNPIYLGMALLFSGFAIVMNALWTLLLLPGMVLALDRGMVRPEENYLTRKFGDRYQQYLRHVPRWI
jgi:protein-S-isoprenylcysteine O-methyltransferase Ste14